MNGLSVVIPTLNESAALPLLLGQLHRQSGIQLQIICADGGSSDGTAQLAAQQGAAICTSARGRGRQMNAGARLAEHEHLLFLHADSELRDDELLAAAMQALRAESQPRCAGHFGLRFIRAAPGHERFYRYLEGKTRLNRPGTINGDQGLLISRSYFAQLGGFDESLPFFEDQRLAAKIFAEGRWLLLPGELWTSARRFEAEGHSARYTLMALTMGLHAAGVSEFFTEAPGIYRAQQDSNALQLPPFLQLARRQLRQRGAVKTLWRAGAYARDNAWQLAYAHDLWRKDAQFSSLNFYDRHLADWLDNLPAQAAATALTAAWFYLYLPLRTHR